MDRSIFSRGRPLVVSGFIPKQIWGFDGDPQFHMSILRNDNVACLCHAFPPMSHIMSNIRKAMSHYDFYVLNRLVQFNVIRHYVETNLSPYYS